MNCQRVTANPTLFFHFLSNLVYLSSKCVITILKTGEKLLSERNLQKGGSSAAIAAGQRSGSMAAVPRPQQSGPPRRITEDEAETFVHQTVRPQVAQRMQQGRQELELTRAQLAQRLNVKESVIAEIENRRAIIDGRLNTLLGKAERLLKVKLRGDLSKPFETKSK
ncbi:hypothetical protein GEMRC1_003181 [Eukaryota sp. GEM-RC1]